MSKVMEEEDLDLDEIENQEEELEDQEESEQSESDDSEPTDSEEEQQDEDSAGEAEDSEGEDGEEQEDGPVVTFGDEEPGKDGQDEFAGKPAPKWVKDIRKRVKELERENRELRKSREAEQQEKELPKLPSKPTLADCGYDEDKFHRETESWFAKKADYDKALAESQERNKRAEKAAEARRARYQEASAKFAATAKDYSEAESDVLHSLGQTKFSLIACYTKSPEAMIYGLSKSEAKLKELSQIEDIAEFAFAVADLQTGLKVTQKKPTTAPERKLRGGTSPTSAGKNAKLEELRDYATRTGDFTKLSAYKAKLREQQQSKR